MRRRRRILRSPMLNETPDCVYIFFRDISSNTMCGTYIMPVNQFLENTVERIPKLREK